jgi:hypothetical protein
MHYDQLLPPPSRGVVRHIETVCEDFVVAVLAPESQHILVPCRRNDEVTFGQGIFDQASPQTSPRPREAPVMNQTLGTCELGLSCHKVSLINERERRDEF